MKIFFVCTSLFMFSLVAGALEKRTLEHTQNPDSQISLNRYVTGGVIGSVVGFGVGHAIQKRYRKDNAWIFTAGEALALTYFLASGLFACDGVNAAERDSCSDGVQKKALTGSLVYLGFHIWEVIDLWTGAEVQHSQARIAPVIFNSETPGLLFALKF